MSVDRPEFYRTVDDISANPQDRVNRRRHLRIVDPNQPVVGGEHTPWEGVKTFVSERFRDLLKATTERVLNRAGVVKENIVCRFELIRQRRLDNLVSPILEPQPDIVRDQDIKQAEVDARKSEVLSFRGKIGALVRHHKADLINFVDLDGSLNYEALLKDDSFKDQKLKDLFKQMQDSNFKFSEKSKMVKQIKNRNTSQPLDEKPNDLVDYLIGSSSHRRENVIEIDPAIADETTADNVVEEIHGWWRVPSGTTVWRNIRHRHYLAPFRGVVSAGRGRGGCLPMVGCGIFRGGFLAAAGLLAYSVFNDGSPTPAQKTTPATRIPEPTPLVITKPTVAPPIITTVAPAEAPRVIVTPSATATSGSLADGTRSESADMPGVLRQNNNLSPVAPITQEPKVTFPDKDLLFEAKTGNGGISSVKGKTEGIMLEKARVAYTQENINRFHQLASIDPEIRVAVDRASSDFFASNNQDKFAIVDGHLVARHEVNGQKTEFNPPSIGWVNSFTPAAIQRLRNYFGTYKK